MLHLLGALGAAMALSGRVISRATILHPGPGRGRRSRPSRTVPPMNGARECARRRRQAAARAAR